MTLTSLHTQNISRLTKRLDLCGIALLVIGAGCYLRAWLGMGTLRANGGSLSKARYAGLAEYDGYWRLSRYGLWIGVAAIVLLIISAALAWRAKRATVATTETVPAAV